MRLAIFGGTGGTGLELTRQALEKGHSVRVLVRNPKRMPLADPNMRVVLGNVLEPESVRKTVLGSDAVLSCLGQRNLLRNTRVVSAGTHSIMEAMRAQGVRRLVVESAFGAGESLALANLLERLLFATLLWAPYQDKNLLEPEVKASGLEWTILRPTLLTNGPRTERYAVSAGASGGAEGCTRGRGGGDAAGGGRAAMDWRIADGDGGVVRGFKVSGFQGFKVKSKAKALQSDVHIMRADVFLFMPQQDFRRAVLHRG